MKSSDLDTPRYPQKVAAALSGIQPKTMQTWLNRGLLQPAGKPKPGPGTGHHRLYSAHDVLGIVVLGRLTKVGVVGPLACQIAQGIRARLKDYRKVQSESDGEFHNFISHSAGDYPVKPPPEMTVPEAPAGEGVDFALVDDAGKNLMVQCKHCNGLREYQNDAAVFLNLGRVIDQTLSDLDHQAPKVSI